MRLRKGVRSISVVLLSFVVSQASLGQNGASDQHHYRLIDLGTFGGPHGQVNSFSIVINKHGVVACGASTSDPDPDCTFDFPFCFYFHSFRWRNGKLIDLGTLPGGNNSFTDGINDYGTIVGLSENGVTDPLIGGVELKAVLWKDNVGLDLGTLGGNQSFGTALNNHHQVVGWALNGIPSDNSVWGPLGTQQRAFLWQNDVMKDIGDLGGPSSAAYLINDRGQISGQSFVDSKPNPSTGTFDLHPFFYENGRMSDMGTLGGTAAEPVGMNDRGDVAGDAFLTGDEIVHGFLWSNGKMHDLGTLGGDFSTAYSVNDKRAAVGWAFTKNNARFRAVRWKNGKVLDLGTPDGAPCAAAFSINAKGQIVGSGQTCEQDLLHAFLWDKGRMTDLNVFVPPALAVTLFEATFISDRGEITVAGSFPNGNVHTFLLTPCGVHERGCRGDIRRAASVRNRVTAPIPGEMSAFGRVQVGGKQVPGSGILRSRRLVRARTFSTPE
jgi:probable HAF family extracellular repeat protein